MSSVIRFSLRRLRHEPQIVNRKFLSTSTTLYTSSSKETQHYDVIIAGGGLVGTTLACSLSKNKILSEKKILLLEGAPAFQKFNSEGQYKNRVSAINQSSVDLFEKIGAWEKISNARIKPVKQMQVWDASSDALITFNNNNFIGNVAYIIENDLILDAVYDQLEESSNVDIRNLSKIENVNLPKGKSNNNQVELKTGEIFTCDLLVGADGANSIVRKTINADVFSIDYERIGLVATLELSDHGDNSVAWQRFIPNGPVALLPLNDTMSSLVWSTSRAQAKDLMAMSEEQFVNALNAAFYTEYPKSNIAVNALRALDFIMGKNTDATRQYPPKVNKVIEKSRACFPLGFLHSSSYIAAGCALVGDAAHRIHPLAGQGVNLGFSDVRFLTNVLSDAVYAGARLGSHDYLLRYEQMSLSNNIPIMIGVHGLHTLYSTTFSPVVLLRSLGLQLTQNIPQIKENFMKRAMG